MSDPIVTVTVLGSTPAGMVTIRVWIEGHGAHVLYVDPGTFAVEGVAPLIPWLMRVPPPPEFQYR